MLHSALSYRASTAFASPPERVPTPSLDLLPFREIWAVDFEFFPDANLLPVPVCLVAWELKSGRKIRLWKDEIGALPPYCVDREALFVAYYAPAEMGCHLALGWPVPERVLDLFTEFKCATNGLPVVAGNGLLGALTHHGLDSIGTTEKAEMRQLILDGGPWSHDQKTAILDYCETDVAALARLLPTMLPRLDLPRALLRGRYMAAVGRMERNGIPMDMDHLHRLRTNWQEIKNRLVRMIDAAYGIYEGSSFKTEKFAAWLERSQIPWPRLPSGRLDLADDTFRAMARSYPQLAPLHELRHTLGQLRLNELAVGLDGRNRTMLSAFRSKTGRNQPSNSKFIFGPSTWIRGLIKPPPGMGIAYIDWKQQEFGIAAALSGDPLMMDAYVSGDPYLSFAKQAGAVPPTATKATHKAEREQYKACILAVQYGMGAESLAVRIGQPTIVVRDLLDLHRRTYKQFWTWSDGMLDDAMLGQRLQTVFGWPLFVTAESRAPSLRNFPMQANGAEMLRLACCIATEAGIEVCAPIHDAVLIAAPLEALDDKIEHMRHIMAEASRIVLKGFELGTDVVKIIHPDRYMDERGAVMWETVIKALADIENEARAQ